MAITATLSNELKRLGNTTAHVEIKDLLDAVSVLSGEETAYIDGVTAGVAAANKALVLGASKEIATITTATITTLTAPTVNATNVDAGADAVAGTIDVFPATTAKGKIIISCVDNVTAHNLTITNAALNGASKTATFPAVTGYVAESTAALTLAQVDVLAAVTPGTAAPSKALVLGVSSEIATITSATITTLTAPTVNAVNVDAGASGAAGSVDVFPTTASKGKLAFTCTDQAGNTTVSVVAAAMAAARTLTIPDPGAAASFVMTEGAQTINGAKTLGTMPIIPTATVAALGTTQADAAAITTGFTLVSGADAAKGVILPTAVAGLQCIVKNNAAAVLRIWPNTSDAINAIAADGVFDVASLTSLTLVAYDATTWYSVPLVAS